MTGSVSRRLRYDTSTTRRLTIILHWQPQIVKHLQKNESRKSMKHVDLSPSLLLCTQHTTDNKSISVKGMAKLEPTYMALMELTDSKMQQWCFIIFHARIKWEDTGQWHARQWLLRILYAGTTWIATNLRHASLVCDHQKYVISRKQRAKFQLHQIICPVFSK